jgi:superfamily II DNA helicase RecQ
MHEQQQKLQDLGISSICLDGDMDLQYNLLDQLDKGIYRAIFTTPEFIFHEDSRVADLWSRVGWMRRLQAVVVDEAHCVTTWGRTFRKRYLRLGDLRAKVHPQTAFVAVSATLPAKILEDVKRILHFRTHSIYNTGNDRPNIRLEVNYFKKTRLVTLDFLTDLRNPLFTWRPEKRPWMLLTICEHE